MKRYKYFSLYFSTIRHSRIIAETMGFDRYFHGLFYNSFKYEVRIIIYSGHISKRRFWTIIREYEKEQTNSS